MATRKKASKATAEQPKVKPLALPAELTIYTVGELHLQWREWLQQAALTEGPASVQADAVDEIDGAGLQLLLSLANGLEGRGTPLQLLDPSEALRTGCAALGLVDWLQRRTAQGAPA